MKVFHINLKRECDIKWIFSIDPGFKTSGFALVDLESKKVDTWGAPANDVPIQGVPFPDLYRIARERSLYYLSQIPDYVDLSKTEFIIEYTMLNRQFSTSLNVLVAVAISMIMEKTAIPKLTLIQPRTSQWFIKLRSAKPSEIKRFVTEKFPKEWAKKGKWNSHAADALLILAYCHHKFFKDLGIELREPLVEFIERTL